MNKNSTVTNESRFIASLKHARAPLSMTGRSPCAADYSALSGDTSPVSLTIQRAGPMGPGLNIIPISSVIFMR